jgi:hypothetical protein
MKELKDYYEKHKKIWFCVSIVTCGFLNMGLEFLREYLINLPIPIHVIPPSIVFLGYRFLLDHINKECWKKKYPQYNVSGEWEGTTTYTGKFDEKFTHVQYVKKSIVNIVQTCESIKIEPSIGKDFECHSIAAEWGDDKSLNILYKVEYKENSRSKGYSERRSGYESMHIEKSDFKEALKMSGKFWHCVADDKKPMYMGDVIYKRIISIV